MPAIVGPFQINNISGGGVVHMGDVVVISPKSASKTSEGSGSGNTGGFILTFNGASVNPTLDPNVVDQPITGTA